MQTEYTSLTLIAPPSILPVSLTEAKLFARVDGFEEDELIKSLIWSAARSIEQYAWVQVSPATYRVCYDGWHSEITLPKPPLQSLIVKYLDEQNDLQTLPEEQYEVDTYGNRVCFYDGLPSLGNGANPVQIDITCGHANVPEDVKLCIKALVKYWYDNRTTDLPGQFFSMLGSFSHREVY